MALGAVTITLGISALALGMTSAAEAGWGAPATVVGLVVGLAGLVAFVVVERWSAHSLVPLGVFRRKPVVTANLVMLLLGGTLTGLFFFLPQYQQQGLGMSPLETGMAQLPFAVMIMLGSIAAPQLAKVVGLARALSGALVVLLIGLLGLVLSPTTCGFSLPLLGAFLLIGLGMGLGLVNATAMGVSENARRRWPAQRPDQRRPAVGRRGRTRRPGRDRRRHRDRRCGGGQRVRVHGPRSSAPPVSSSSPSRCRSSQRPADRQPLATAGTP